MAKIDDNRRTNARELAEKAGGPAKFARKIGVSDTRVTQLIGVNFTRNIGSKTAAHIEQIFEQAPGWLDADHSTNTLETQPPSQTLANVQLSTVSLAYVTAEELKLLTHYREATDIGKKIMTISAESAEKDLQKIKGIRGLVSA